MNIISSLSGLYGRVKNYIMQRSAVRRAFNVEPEASPTMEQNINTWYAMYVNHPDWETKEIVPLGLPGAICRELSRTALVEFTASITGSPRADYLNEQFQAAASKFLGQLELGLAVGGIAFRPYLYGDRILVDAISATAFTPTKFGPDGTCTGGVFKDLAKYNGNYYVRLEYANLEGTSFTIRNKAYNSDSSGSIRDEVPLNTVSEWADLPEEITIQNVKKPLFGYFKVPKANDVETDSKIGVSVYGGATVNHIKSADEQWDLIRWEYKSGQRKVLMDGNSATAEMFDCRLFEVGNFSRDGNFYQVFSPEFRDTPLYNGFQNILRLIEFQVGLAYGTISEQREKVDYKTATEIQNSKHNMFVTVKNIQDALKDVFDTLIYAMDMYATIYSLAPPGEYKATYDFGNSILDDEDTRRERFADMRIDVSANLIKPEIYVSQKYKVSIEEARAMMPTMEDMTEPGQNEVE